MREEPLHINLTDLELRVQKLSDDIFNLSRKPGEMIERKFYKEVVLPLKEVLSFAQNIHFEIYRRTEVTTHLDYPKLGNS